MVTQKEKVDRCIAWSFRNVADADYIAARSCWRRDFDHQFFWMALQAVEKYLKGILLFHRKSVKDFSHDIGKLLNEVKKLPVIDLKLQPEVEKFVKILNEQGLNRYFEWNIALRGQEILLLDELVWHLRVRCVAVVGEVKDRDGQVIWNFQEHFQQVRNHRPGKSVHHIVIPFGRLERILSSKSEAKDDLVWKNFYWGRRHKRHIKFSPKVRFESSSIVIYPDTFNELNKLVWFSKDVREHFQSPGKQQAKLNQWTMHW